MDELVGKLFAPPVGDPHRYDSGSAGKNFNPVPFMVLLGTAALLGAIGIRVHDTLVQ